VIVLEDLHVRGMQRNKHLALSISDASMGELRRQLAYKSEWYGSTLVIADRFFPSSKLCSGCGVIKDTLSLSERVFECDACGISLDRDENAAINLRRLGLGGLPVDRREVKPVERKALALASVSVKPTSLNQEATADGARRPTRRSTSKGVLGTGSSRDSSQREAALQSRSNRAAGPWPTPTQRVARP
jgi:putative transposase